MATASERQRRLRTRRREDTQWRQLNLWVSVDAFEKLNALCKATGKTQRAVLDDLLQQARYGKASGRKKMKKKAVAPSPTHQLQLFPD